MSTSVLIVGGGIAGSAAAYWLQRFGFTCTVVERADAPRPGGHAVDLRGASPRVVEQMGLLDAVRARSLHERGVRMVDAQGRIRVEMPADAFGGSGMVADLEILRGDLAEILADATRDTVERRYGESVVALEQDADGVQVRFRSGAEQRFDLVVGADGSHSTVRRLVFGPESEFSHPLGAYTAHYSISARQAEADGLDRGDDWFMIHNAPGRRMVGTRPDRDGGVKAMFILGTEGVDESVLRDPVAQRRLLHDRFADMSWHTPALLAAMETADDFYFDAYAQVKMPTWVKGRVVLLGDAGYCPSPASGTGHQPGPGRGVRARRRARAGRGRALRFHRLRGRDAGVRRAQPEAHARRRQDDDPHDGAGDPDGPRVQPGHAEPGRCVPWPRVRCPLRTPSRPATTPPSSVASVPAPHRSHARVALRSREGEQGPDLDPYGDWATDYGRSSSAASARAYRARLRRSRPDRASRSRSYRRSPSWRGKTWTWRCQTSWPPAGSLCCRMEIPSHA